MNGQLNHSYAAPVKARDGTLIPVFADGKTMYSRYAPLKDAQTFAQKAGNAVFVIVFGLGSGLHIQALLNCGVQHIIVLEENTCSIHFLTTTFNLAPLLSDFRITVCTPQELYNTITTKYIPALYGDAICLPQRAWADHHTEITATATAILKEAIVSLSADFSVQAHFGKLWHRNIFQNLHLAGKLQTCTIPQQIFDKAHKQQKAVVTGAGPTLERYLPYIKQYRQDICVIAADTTLQPLLQNNIIPDITVTLDGQQISAEHFYGINAPQMLLAADFCANCTLTRRLAQQNYPILFTYNKHPLSTAAARYINSKTDSHIPYIETGGGTVIMAALDLAVQLGFTDIALAGADFGYTDGKPYTQGTYLDKRYYSLSTRVQPAEYSFASLMYRGDSVKKQKNFFSTPVLQQYYNSYLTYKQKNADVLIMRLGYETSDQPCFPGRHTEKTSFIPARVSYSAADSFSAYFVRELAALLDKKEVSVICSSPVFIALLPLMAYYRRTHHAINTTDSYLDFLNFAYTQTSHSIG